MRLQFKALLVFVLFVTMAPLSAEPHGAGQASSVQRRPSAKASPTIYRCRVVRHTLGDTLWGMAIGGYSHTTVSSIAPSDGYDQNAARAACLRKLEAGGWRNKAECSCATFKSLGLDDSVATFNQNKGKRYLNPVSLSVNK